MHKCDKHSHIFSFTTVSAVALTVLTTLSGLLLSAPHTSADSSAGVTVTVTVPAVCSLAASSDSVSTTIYPGSSGFIGSTIIKAICNDPAGLAVYAVGYTNNTYGNTNLESTVGGTTNIISTNATISDTPANSEWHMTINAVSGTYAPTIVSAFENAPNAIPQQYTKVAYRDTMTDMGINATGANFTADFNAYIANNQAAGTYTGKVKFLLVHPSTHVTPITPVAVAHQICYYGNEEDEGAMACQSVSANTEVDLRAPNFSKFGYGFTGWNTKDDGTGTQYGPMEIIAITQDMYDNGLMLFANWKAAETDVTMQTFNSTNYAGYSTDPIDTVIALRDERDYDVYAVAKLDDGKWWMIENLRIDYAATQGSANAALSRGYGGVFAGLALPETSLNTTADNSLYTIDANSTDLRIITGGDSTYHKYRVPRYNNRNTASRVANETSYDQNIYSYGNYYNWPAATASTVQRTTKNQSITGTALCPTGWRLPKGGNADNEANSEWWDLIVNHLMDGVGPDGGTHYTSGIRDVAIALKAYPTNQVYAGAILGSSSVNSRGLQGQYWSSTNSDSNYAYRESIQYALGSGVSNASPGANAGAKTYGLSVRCIAAE